MEAGMETCFEADITGVSKLLLMIWELIRELTRKMIYKLVMMALRALGY